MNAPTLGLTALLMLSGSSLALAQDGPRDRPPDAARNVERGPGVESSGSAETRREKGSRDDGPAADAPDRMPNRDGADRRSQDAQDGSDGPPKAERKRAQRDDTRDGGKPRQKASDEAKEKKGADRKTRAEKSDDTKKARGTAADSAKSERDSAAKSEANRKDRATPDKDAADAVASKPGETSKQAADGPRKPPEDVKKADLSGDKRARVSTEFRSGQAKRRTDVHIDISIGRRLPRDWVIPVPVAVIAVVPEYSGYVYAYVDDEYVICDPVTYEVVAVLPASGSGQTYASGGGSADRCSTNLVLDADERAYVLRSIQITDEVDVSDITVGWAVPGNIELRTFPEPIVSHTGKLASCRYFLADDQIAIVDPAEEKVVLLIEQN